MDGSSPLVLPATESASDVRQGTVFFIGTATVLIRFAGFTILTDPNFIHRHEKVSIGYGMHTERLTDPAIEIHDLPPLDLVVLSHFHGDHFDQVAERELDKGLLIVTPPQAAGELGRRGFTAAHPLPTWSSVTIAKGETRLRITAAPGNHGPAIVGELLPDVMGSILEFETAGGTLLQRVYITGDTLLIDELNDIPVRYPEVDLALIHLGGTRVLGILVTMDDQQGVQLLELVQPAHAIPIHYNDYDVFKSPIEDFQQAVQAAGLAECVHVLRHGETYTFTATT